MPRKRLRCVGGVWEVSGECLGSVLESVREVSEECLRSDWGVFGKCLSNAWEVSEKVSGSCLGSV